MGHDTMQKTMGGLQTGIGAGAIAMGQPEIGAPMMASGMNSLAGSGQQGGQGGQQDSSGAMLSMMNNPMIQQAMGMGGPQPPPPQPQPPPMPQQPPAPPQMGPPPPPPPVQTPGQQMARPMPPGEPSGIPGQPSLANLPLQLKRMLGLV